MLSLPAHNQADVVEAFCSASRYIDFLLNINDFYFKQMVSQIYPTELELNKANSFSTESPFLILALSITNGIGSSKIYDKMDDFTVSGLVMISHFLMKMFLAHISMVYTFYTFVLVSSISFCLSAFLSVCLSVSLSFLLSLSLM